MTLLPIAGREMRVAARRPMTYWVRTIAALALLVLGTWFFLMMWREPPREAGLVIFGVLTGTTVLFSLLSGIRATSDCISQEKRDGTLGLLFLTDLKGYDVVLGKLAANSINAFYGVLAVVPLLAVPLLMGGVSPAAFGRMALVTVNTLFFSLALGIFASSLLRDARNSAGATFLALVFFAGGGPALGAWMDYRGFPRGLEQIPFLTSPGFTFACAFDAMYAVNRNGFWISLALAHAFGWGFLAFASLIVPHTWQDRPSAGPRLSLRERWRNWTYGNEAQRRALRTECLDQNAFFWLCSRARLKPAVVWWVLALLGCAWLGGWLKWRQDWVDPGVFATMGIILNVLMKGWVASETGRQIVEDRKSGALELLLSTPITIREVVHGQWLALRRQFFAPFVVVLAVWFISMVVGGRDMHSRSDRSSWFLFWIAMTAMLALDLVTIFWVGLAQSLTARSAQHAANATAARVFVVPWVGFALVMLVVSLDLIRSRGTSPEFVLGLWFFMGLMADLFFGFASYNRVMSEFRSLAEQRFVARPGFWKRLMGE